MSPDDVSPNEMGTNRYDEGDELERLLEGSAETRELLPELAVFVDDLLVMPAPSPGAEELHVAAMMSESSRLLADKGDPVARPVSNAHGPARQVSGLPMRRSIPMVKLIAKVMAPLVAVFTLMGGLAYAQVLPDPLQNAVADAGGAVGLDIPGTDDGDVEEAGDVDEVDNVDEADKADVEDEAGDVDEIDDNDEADENDNSGPGGGSDDEDADDNSGPGGGDETDDDGDVDDEADENDNSGPGGGSDDEADDDSDDSGHGGGGSDDEPETDDDSDNSGHSGSDSDDEVDEVESED